MAEKSSRAVYVISVAAELAGLHPQTLRIYERKGLVDPARTGGGSRRYSDEDIAQLRRIQELTTEGLNLAGVQKVLELEGELAAARRALQAAREGANEAVEQTRRQYPSRARPAQPIDRALSSALSQWAGELWAIRTHGGDTWSLIRCGAHHPGGYKGRRGRGERETGRGRHRRPSTVWMHRGGTTTASWLAARTMRSGATPRSSSMLVGGWPTLRPRPAPSSASDRRTWWAQRSGSWLLRRTRLRVGEVALEVQAPPLVRFAPTSQPSPFGSRGDTTGRLARCARSVGGDAESGPARVLVELSVDSGAALDDRSQVVELQERVNQLERTNHQLETLACTAAHELKAPLASLAASVEELVWQSGPDLDETGQELVGSVLWRVREMGELVDRVIHSSVVGTPLQIAARRW